MPAWWRSSCGSPCRDGSVFTKNKNAGLTSSVFSATIHLAFAGVAHLVERDLAKVEVASSSLVARSKKKHHPSGWCFLFGMSRAGLNSLPRPARSALNQEVRQGSCEWLCHSWDAGSESSLVACSKKERHPHGCLSFLEQHFCYAKVVACGRVIEREWGNPSKVPPSHSPFLAVGGSADNKTCEQSQKETPSVRMVFSFWNVAGSPELAASTCAQRVKSSAMRAPRAGICS